MKNRTIFISMILCLISLPVFSSGNQEEGGAPKKVNLEVAVNYTNEWSAAMEELLREYEAQNPHVTIDYQAPGGRYEDMMKVKMAAQEMPDLFSTHGWSKARYGDFLYDLSGEAWSGNVSEAMKEIVFDENGKLYVLPFDSDKSGPIYNVDIFNKYGLEVPETLDDLLEVSRVIAEKSNGAIAPIGCAADGWPEAQFFDFIATAFFISDSNNYEGDALLDGSFDWKKWEPVAEVWQEMKENGYINEDMLTSTFSDNISSFAEGKSAIGFYGPYYIEEAKKLNPSINADMMPIPAVHAGDSPTFAGGEKSTIGVWKDSENLEESLRLVEFLARPENVAKIAGATQLPPGINGVELNAGSLNETFKRYDDVRVFPYFDRVYLPSGMWDTMVKTSQMLIAGAATPADAAEEMRAEYIRLRMAQ